MPFNGSNTFTIVNTFVPGTTILSSAVNANFTDIATGLSDCVTRDAQGAVTGNLLLTSTGFIQLPNGTSGQRPGSPSAGTFRFNSTTSMIEFYDGTNWQSPLIPLGAMIPYTGSSAPTNYLFPFGQQISQTTYASLYALYGPNRYGSDSGGNFFLPDVRGRAIFAPDNMGGSGASRLTTAGSGVDGTTIGASGGNQLMQQHNHAITDPGHIHTGTATSNGSNISTRGDFAGSGAITGLTVGTPVTFAVASATTGITINNNGSGSSQNVPPAIVLPCILRVL